MSVIMWAAIAKGVLSVLGVDQFVKLHNNKSQPLSEERLHSEIMISLNGTTLDHCSESVKKSMRKYLAKSVMEGDIIWHYVRIANNIKQYSVPVIANTDT